MIDSHEMVTSGPAQATARRDPRGQKILYIQYTNPGAYPPLEHSARILADRGWRVQLLGTGSHGAHALRFEPHANIEIRQMSFCPGGWKQKLHYAAFCVWVAAWALIRRPRWVYASDPMACPIALVLSWMPGLRVIYHEHDSPAGGGNEFVNAWIFRARRLLASRAIACVLPNQVRGEVFRAEVGGLADIKCVWNCPSLEELAKPQEDGSDDLWVLYHGSIVPARLPISVVEALAAAPAAVKLRIVGYQTVGSMGYVDEILQNARRLGVSHRVQVIDAMPRKNLLELCRECHVGLSLMPTSSSDVNMEQMVGASNKAFDYLACGLALLVSDLPRWIDTYVRTGYGLSCVPEDAASVASTLNWFHTHRENMREMGKRGRDRIQTDWNYERQFAPVLTLLEQA